MSLKTFFNLKFSLILSLSISIFSVRAQSGKVYANGILIAYESFGRTTGPAIILINGMGTPMTDWPLEFCKKLAQKGFRVIRFDNRDVGLSTKLDSLGSPDWTAIALL